MNTTAKAVLFSFFSMVMFNARPMKISMAR